MKALVLFLISAASFSICGPSAFALQTLPDFGVQVGHDTNSKQEAWILKFTAPKDHHINLEAPMKVRDGDLSFIRSKATLHAVWFRLSDPKLIEGSEVSASLFLCDEAKTYCVKKKQTFVLKADTDSKSLTENNSASGTAAAAASASVSDTATVKLSSHKKDEHGFWDNDLASALAESAKTKKPILIDFYGIWCPPCNLFSETVFGTKKFKNASKKWVLLKMDADAETSFELKSHFKIGGYPTILAVKAFEHPRAAAKALVEIDRIVGFYPVDEFLKMVDSIYASRNQSLAEQLASRKTAYVDLLKEAVEVSLEKKEFPEAVKLCEEGQLLSKTDHYFSLTRLSALASEGHAEVLKDPASLKILSEIWNHRADETSDTLVRFEDVLTSHSEAFTKAQIVWANDALDELQKRILPETMSVPGVELSIADIDSMRVDVADALNDPNLEKKSYARVVDSYQKLIALQHAENSRGYHLELAYALWKSGKVDAAKAMYAKFISLYPKEFTFYFAAARMDLELKDYASAKRNAEKAVEYAYGDNKIRAMERLVRVLIASGEKQEALKQGRAFLLGSAPVSSDLFVRTNRYVQALQKAVNDAKNGKI